MGWKLFGASGQVLLPYPPKERLHNSSIVEHFQFDDATMRDVEEPGVSVRDDGEEKKYRRITAVPSSFLFLVVRPGATCTPISSLLAL